MDHMEIRDRIHLRDHVVTADIGAFQSEKGNQQRLRFNLTVELADISASRDDQVDTVLSYDVLTQAVTTALADQRYNLVETLAEKIAAEVLAHPRAAQIEVKVEKLDRGPGALGVTINRNSARVAADQTLPTANLILWQSPARLPDGATIIIPATSGHSLPEGGDPRRVALLSLDQAAWVLAQNLGLEVTETRTEMEHAIRSGSSVVWAPYQICADMPDLGADPLTLALWLAGRVGSQELLVSQPESMPLPVAPTPSRVRIVPAQSL